MRIAMALLAVSLTFGVSCKKKAKPGDPVAEGSGSDMGSAMGSAAGSDDSAAAGSGSDTAPDATVMTKKGGNCPSLVAGSVTTAELKDGKVMVTVTSEDKDAILAIQKRATELLKDKAAGTGSGSGHDQKGTHGGTMGMCPVFLGDGGTATSADDAKGVIITITPKDKAEALKAEVDARITKAAEWQKANIKEGDHGTTGGVGGGSGEHGSNHSGEGDSKGKDRKGDGKGGGKGSGGGGGMGTGGGDGDGSGGGSGSGSGK